jgi:arginase
VARAPAALRRAGLIEALRALGPDVRDRGDLALGPTGPDRDPSSQVIAPAALTTMIEVVRDEVDAIVRAGRFPLVLGGDCPILLGCLAAPAVADAGLLFVDGHEDAWPPDASATGEAADMELGLALGRGIDRLPEPLLATMPRLDPSRVVVIGARDEVELAEAGVESIADVVEVIRPDAIDPDWAGRLGADTAERLAPSGRTWYHVDLDVLATASLEAVDYQLPGGLDWAALTSLSRGALASAAVAGWDVTIYNPDLDPGGDDAARIVDYLVDVFRD